MKGLIVSGGSKLDKLELKKHCDRSQLVVAADKGIELLLEVGCKIDYLIGDFDSINQEVLEQVKKSNIKIVKYPIAKDDTDTELAVNLLVELGCKYITLVGVTGSRLDHTMANISILRKLALSGVKAKIIDNNNIIEYLYEKSIIEKKDDYYISIIPISLEGVVISLEGFYFPLNEKNISYGSSLGVSNYLVKDSGNVIKHSGEALLLQSKD